MKCITAWLCASIPCALATMPVWAENKSPQLQSIIVSLGHVAEFTVIYNRDKSLMAGAIVASVVGAAIQKSVQAAQDEALTKQVLHLNPDIDCGQPLLDAMNVKLKSTATRAFEVVADPNVVLAQVDIHDCTLHIADSKEKRLSSYVSLTLTVKPSNGESWHEDIQISGRNRYSLDDFTNQPSLARTELMDVVVRAGTRAANKIIYRQ